MIGAIFRFIDTTQKVVEAAEKASYRNTGHAAASIRKDAMASIVPSDEPSEPGTPPHTHTQKITKKGKVRQGHLPRAIVFHNSKESAIVGPRYSVVGTAGDAHEFGGEYKGDDYPERAFMGPALERKAAQFGNSFAGSIGE